MPTPVDLLIETGTLLYGEDQWMQKLADVLDIDRESVRQWKTGRMRFPPDHPVLDKLMDLIDLRMAALTELRLKFLEGATDSNVVTIPRQRR